MMSTTHPFVLLIDDDEHSRAIFEILMEHHQYRFSVATNGLSAIDYLRHHLPDIIIVELFLPDPDGFQTLDLIRNQFDPTTCRILATTAYSTQDTVMEVMQRGFDGYVPKPFSPGTFFTYLSRVSD